MAHLREFGWRVFLTVTVLRNVAAVERMRHRTRTRAVASANLIQRKALEIRLQPLLKARSSRGHVTHELYNQDASPDKVPQVASYDSTDAALASHDNMGLVPTLVSYDVERFDHVLNKKRKASPDQAHEAHEVQGDCKEPCRGMSGYCDYCGLGRACCSRDSHKKTANFNDYAEECSRAEFPDESEPFGHTCVNVAPAEHSDGVPWLQELNFFLGTVPIFGNSYIDYNMSMILSCGKLSLSRFTLKHDHDVFSLASKGFAASCQANTSLSVALFGMSLYNSTIQNAARIRNSSFEMEFSLPPAHTLTPQIRSKTCEEALDFFDIELDMPDVDKYGSVIGFLLATFPQSISRAISTTVQTLLCEGLDMFFPSCLDPFLEALANKVYPSLLQHPPQSNEMRPPGLLTLNTSSHYDVNDCWGPCGEQEGWCVICPGSYACCQQGTSTSDECIGVPSQYFKQGHRHECVPSQIAEPWMRSLTFGEPLIQIPDFDLLGWKYNVYDLRCGGARFEFASIELVDTGINVHFSAFGLECAAQMRRTTLFGLVNEERGGIHFDLNNDESNIVGFFFEVRLADDGGLGEVKISDCAFRVHWHIRHFGHWTSGIKNAGLHILEKFLQPRLEGIWCKHVSPAILAMVKPRLEQMYTRFHVAPEEHPVEVPPVPPDVCKLAVDAVGS